MIQSVILGLFLIHFSLFEIHSELIILGFGLILDINNLLNPFFIYHFYLNYDSLSTSVQCNCVLVIK